jgi:tetrahydromethanopterin S-methyltransferase subunit E
MEVVAAFSIRICREWTMGPLHSIVDTMQHTTQEPYPYMSKTSVSGKTSFVSLFTLNLDINHTLSVALSCLSSSLIHDTFSVK